MSENVYTNLFVLKKLVRDKRIIDMRNKEWEVNETLIACNKQELIAALHNKAREEVKELDEECKKENNNKKIREALPDVQQVVHDLQEIGEDENNIASYQTKINLVCEQYRIDIQEVLKLTQELFEKDGGFLGGHYVNWIKMKSTDEWHAYFVKKYGIASGL